MRYEVTARLIRVGIFNFDVTRSHVLDFRRSSAPQDVITSSPPGQLSFVSSYIFGPQMNVRDHHVSTLHPGDLGLATSHCTL